MADRTQYGEWEKLESRGKGGQGEVFRARKASAQQQVYLNALADAIRNAAGYELSSRNQSAEAIVTLVRELAKEAVIRERAQIGAIKVLHALADGHVSQKAAARMVTELEALQRFEHPGIVRILDANIGERWFVMEYFEGGTLVDHLGKTKGDLLGSLLAFRPLVHATSELHRSGLIHRDIKPQNVFVAGDGRLVLGDFGLVIDTGAVGQRVTDTYENVGSRDWMPGWALGKRMDDVRPTFDVFSLGKLLWSMISGEPVLRLWYFQTDESNVERIFPNDRSFRWANRIFKKCIVEHESDCVLKNAGELLGEVDEVISVLKRGGQVPAEEGLRCVVCGHGRYSPVRYVPPNERDLTLACNFCGNIQKFQNVKDSPG
jgi:serine/threonine protein kinase